MGERFGMGSPHIDPGATWEALDILENEASHNAEEIAEARIIIGEAVIKAAWGAINKRINKPEDERQIGILGEVIAKLYKYYTEKIDKRIKKHFPDLKSVLDNPGRFAKHIKNVGVFRVLDEINKEKRDNDRYTPFDDESVYEFVIGKNNFTIKRSFMYEDIEELLAPENYSKEVLAKLYHIQEEWENTDWDKLFDEIEAQYDKQPEWFRGVISRKAKFVLKGK